MKVFLLFITICLLAGGHGDPEVVDAQHVLSAMEEVYDRVIEGKLGTRYQEVAAQCMRLEDIKQCMDFLMAENLTWDKEHLALGAYISFFTTLRYNNNKYGDWSLIPYDVYKDAFDAKQVKEAYSSQSAPVKLMAHIESLFLDVPYKFVITDDGLFDMELWLKHFFAGEFLLSIPKDMGLCIDMQAHNKSFKGLLDVVIEHDVLGHGRFMRDIKDALEEWGVFALLGERVMELLEQAAPENKKAVTLVLYYIFHEAGSFPSEEDMTSCFPQVQSFIPEAQNVEAGEVFVPLTDYDDIDDDFAQVVYKEYCQRQNSFVVKDYTQENSKDFCGAVLYQWYRDFIGSAFADIENIIASAQASYVTQ